MAKHFLLVFTIQNNKDFLILISLPWSIVWTSLFINLLPFIFTFFFFPPFLRRACYWCSHSRLIWVILHFTQYFILPIVINHIANVSHHPHPVTSTSLNGSWISHIWYLGLLWPVPQAAFWQMFWKGLRATNI